MDKVVLVVSRRMSYFQTCSWVPYSMSGLAAQGANSRLAVVAIFAVVRDTLINFSNAIILNG